MLPNFYPFLSSLMLVLAVYGIGLSSVSHPEAWNAFNGVSLSSLYRPSYPAGSCPVFPSRSTGVWTFLEDDVRVQLGSTVDTYPAIPHKFFLRGTSAQAHYSKLCVLLGNLGPSYPAGSCFCVFR